MTLNPTTLLADPTQGPGRGAKAAWDGCHGGQCGLRLGAPVQMRGNNRSIKKKCSEHPRTSSAWTLGRARSSSFLAALLGEGSGSGLMDMCKAGTHAMDIPSSAIGSGGHFFLGRPGPL